MEQLHSVSSILEHQVEEALKSFKGNSSLPVIPLSDINSIMTGYSLFNDDFGGEPRGDAIASKGEAPKDLILLRNLVSGCGSDVDDYSQQKLPSFQDAFFAAGSPGDGSDTEVSWIPQAAAMSTHIATNAELSGEPVKGTDVCQGIISSSQTLLSNPEVSATSGGTDPQSNDKSRKSANSSRLHDICSILPLDKSSTVNDMKATAVQMVGTTDTHTAAKSPGEDGSNLPEHAREVSSTFDPTSAFSENDNISLPSFPSTESISTQYLQPQNLRHVGTFTQQLNSNNSSLSNPGECNSISPRLQLTSPNIPTRTSLELELPPVNLHPISHNSASSLPSQSATSPVFLSPTTPSRDSVEPSPLPGSSPVSPFNTRQPSPLSATSSVSSDSTRDPLSPMFAAEEHISGDGMQCNNRNILPTTARIAPTEIQTDENISFVSLLLDDKQYSILPRSQPHLTQAKLHSTPVQTVLSTVSGNLSYENIPSNDHHQKNSKKSALPSPAPKPKAAPRESKNKKGRRHHNDGGLVFACMLCDKKFSHSIGLKNHERSHRQDRNHSCRYCRDVFHYKTQLRRHERIHAKEMHICRYCGETQESDYSLVQHERKHRVENSDKTTKRQTTQKEKEEGKDGNADDVSGDNS